MSIPGQVNFFHKRQEILGRKRVLTLCDAKNRTFIFSKNGGPRAEDSWAGPGRGPRKKESGPAAHRGLLAHRRLLAHRGLLAYCGLLAHRGPTQYNTYKRTN